MVNVQFSTFAMTMSIIISNPKQLVEIFQTMPSWEEKCEFSLQYADFQSNTEMQHKKMKTHCLWELLAVYCKWPCMDKKSYLFEFSFTF